MTQATRWIALERNSWITVFLTLLAAAAIGALNAVVLTFGLPILGTKSTLFLVMLVPALIVVMLVIARSDVGLGVVVLVMTGVISRTGLQLDVGDLRTSALEILVLVVTVLIVVRTRLFTEQPLWPKLVLDLPMFVLALLTFPALLVALDREISATNILYEVKGYFLYPCLAYLMVAWIRNLRRWKSVAATGIVCAGAVAALGVLSWIQGAATYQVSVDSASYSRVSGSFGVINQYGFYLSTMVLLALGFLVSATRRVHQVPIALVSGILFLGIALAGSRGPWIGTVVGMIVFAGLRPRQVKAAWPLILAAGALFCWELPSILSRITLESSSDQARVGFLMNGLEVFKHYPIFGAGWGAGFWLGYESELIPNGLLPWLHNDYLNLLTQVGLVGLGAFAWLWWRVLTSSARAVIALASDEHKNLAAAALAALVAILIEAATDHVFWRPDIAGQVWWIVGLLLAAVSLDSSSGAHAHPSRS